MHVFKYHPPTLPWLDIRYKDLDIIAISKPSGLLSNPGIASITHDCALTRIQRLYPEAILVHRLDCATSGILIFARNKKAESHLKTQFQNRECKKTYIAEVSGLVVKDQGQINLALSPNPNKRPLQQVDPNGKSAITDYRVLERRKSSSLLELKPHTGRTHQLRVHMLALGHPILGDDFYGTRETIQARARLCLHAHLLSFKHPTNGKNIILSSKHCF